jgi:hypothetical protein
MEPFHVAVDAAEYCFLFQYNTWWLCLEKGEWASWMQAFGALGAIWFTVDQIRREKKRASEEKIEKVMIIGQAISNLESRCAQEILYIHDSLYGERQASEMVKNKSAELVLLDVQELARTIQIQYLPDPKSVTRVLELLRTVDEVRQVYARNARLIKGHTDQFSTIQMESFRDQMLKHLHVANKILGRYQPVISDDQANQPTSSS